MSSFEVSDPIQNGPFDKPERYWYIAEGEQPELRIGRRASVVFPPRDQKQEWVLDPAVMRPSQEYRNGYELALVNLIRERVADWQRQGYPGLTRTTIDLIAWWTREGRKQRLFYAQIEAALTVIFLKEGRADLLQGITIPRDEPSDDRKTDGYTGFQRYACKMATGAGKTTVMGMLAAWSILNKVNNRSDARFSDVALVVCPNVTIKTRLQELDPQRGEASIYRTRDLVPPHLIPLLAQGKVIVTNWHVFEPSTVQTGGTTAKVSKAGKRQTVIEKVLIGQRNTTARGKRYMSIVSFEALRASGEITVSSEERDEQGNLKSVQIVSEKYVESDTAVVSRILGREVGGKQNILVMNDEAHHAYRIRPEEPDEDELEFEAENFDDEEDIDETFKETTVWIDGLDKVQKLRGINSCIDLSATPYFLGRVGQDTNKPFPWVVSDFSLIEAIESGLVKVPQLAVRDTTGEEIPGYFNIWQWLIPKLTPAERGASRGSPKPEAVLKYAHHPIALLGGLWEKMRAEWSADGEHDARPPVFILVCKNTAIAKVMYEWLAEDKRPANIPTAGVEGFRNRDGVFYTIRVDSKVVHETDSDTAKSEESRWMRHTLDTVGKTDWTYDTQGRPVYPEGFEELAAKLKRPLHPPGRDVRCIVSVGMLTEGWDCNTVTHIIGLRPFMSQLLCEQVVGRGLRRSSYELNAEGKFEEEVSKVLGVPFEVIPFKANPTGPAPPKVKRYHVHAVPEKEQFKITYPRVEGYTQGIRNRVTMDWQSVPGLTLEPGRIPPEVEMKGLSVNNQGRQSLAGPGRLEGISLAEFRSEHRLQKLVFQLAASLTKDYVGQSRCDVPSHVLFKQLVPIVQRYVDTKVRVLPPADVKDLFLAPYYGWLVEILTENLRPDTASGEAPEVPRYEQNRGPGSTSDVSFWTSKDVREVRNCHLNYAVADTLRWEQSATYYIDSHPATAAFVKNAGLGFAIPYLHNGQMHDYIPDFIVRLKAEPAVHLIIETKGYDEKEEIKAAAARRWVAAVNADGTYGTWEYEIARRPTEVGGIITKVHVANLGTRRD
jgi:type III restriction enzyme